MGPSDIALLVLGIGMLTGVVVDVVGALLGGDGRGGWATDPLGRSLWRFGASRRRTGHHRLAVVIGQTIIVLTLSVWIIGAWLGWTLVFVSSDGAIVESSTDEPAGAMSTVYFTGYTLFTLGIGDFRPTGGGWQFATVLATLSGFAVMTVAITYVVPVVQAASAARGTAALIASHGRDETELVAVLDDPDAAGSVDDLTAAILSLAETAAAFPALHYLHTAGEHRSAPAMISLVGLATTRADSSRPVERLGLAVRSYLRFHPTDRGRPQVDFRDRLVAVRRDDGRSSAPSDGVQSATQPPG